MRVTNMAGVDVNTFEFDFDLTFACLLMNADGTIYHTFGGRDWTDAQSHLSLAGLRGVLETTLAEHDAYAADPHPPERRPVETVDTMPWMKRRVERNKKPPHCYHCHMVHDARGGAAREAGSFTRDDVWIWPDPVQVGLRLERDDQRVVAEVVRGSAAAKAGLRKGDRLTTLAGARVSTFGDVQRALHHLDGSAARVPVTYARGDAARTATLALAKGWKEATPLVFSWRPSKWPLSPKPGFGGPQLKPDQLTQLGLPDDAFAFRVQYLVTWGDDAHTGRNAQAAGLRKGDVVLSVDGKRDFESVAHLHAWFRLTRKAGETVPIEILRGGKRQTLRMKVVD